MTFSIGSSNKITFSKNCLNCFLSYFEQIIAFSTIARAISKLSTITLKLARITHFPMTIFYIYIYLIITVLSNDAIDSAWKCLSVVTHVVQNFVEHVYWLVSLRWEFSLRGTIELTIDLKFCYCLIYSFLLTSFN